MNWDLFKDIAIFFAGLIASSVGYFAKRKIERSHEHKDLEIKEKLLKINRELKEQNLDPEDLKKWSTFMFARLSANGSTEEAEASVAAITETDSDKIITQAEMNQTSFEEFEKAELELKHAYERLGSVLDLEDMRRLDEAQHAWLKFRKKEVILAGGFYEGGSIQPLIQNVEAQALTKARTKELRTLYEERVTL